MTYWSQFFTSSPSSRVFETLRLSNCNYFGNLFNRLNFYLAIVLSSLAIAISTQSVVAADGTNCTASECNYSVPLDKPGFYTVAVTLPADQKEGLYNLLIDPSVPYAQAPFVTHANGFHGGGLLREGGQTPSWLGFSLAQFEPVNVTVYNHSNATSLDLILTNSSSQEQRLLKFGPILATHAQTYTVPALEPGFYTASVSGQPSLPKTAYSISVGGNSVFGGISGGWLDSNNVGWGGFYATQPRTVNLRVQFANYFGEMGAGLPNVQVYLKGNNDNQELKWSSTANFTGSNILTGIILDENGHPIDGATITAKLGDDPNVKSTAISSGGGKFQFSNIPNRTIILEASASGNRFAATAVKGDQNSIQLKLVGFNEPVPLIDNDLFDLSGWNIGTAPVQIITGDLRAKQTPKGNILRLTTKGQGTQSISRTFTTEPGTAKFVIKYRFITTEVPGGYFGSQFNDYYNITIRSKSGEKVSDGRTMNDLGLSAFDASGATEWRELSLKVSDKGDTVQIDLAVANVADGALDSSLEITDTQEKLEILDPACSGTTVCDGNFLQVKKDDQQTEKVIILDNPAELLNAKVERSGAVTDGVTQLLLRMKSEEPIIFTLNEAQETSTISNCKWGKLMQRDGSQANCGSITATPVDVGGEKYVFAAYQSPLNFPLEASTGLMPAKVTIEARKKVDEEPISKRELQLFSPPVMLVHGVWDSAGAWSPVFLPKLKKYNVYTVDHSSGEFPAAGTFDPLSPDSVAIPQLIKEIKKAVDDFRTMEIALSQVDVVGHSMGGLITRATVKTKNYGYQYNRINNYNKGDFHKIITIGTPHQGTRIADVLVHGKCRERKVNCKPKWDISIIPPKLQVAECQPERLETTFSNLFKTPLIGKIIGHHELGPAIYGFQTGSTAIKNIGDTPVPSHAIVGIAPTGILPPSVSPIEVVLNKVFDSYAFKTVDGLSTVDEILGGNENHDTIVPVQSQQGGLSGNAISTFQNVDHLGEIGGLGGNIIVPVPVSLVPPLVVPVELNAEAPKIADEVLSLLQKSPDSSAFGHFTALPQQAGKSNVNFEADRNRCEASTTTTKRSLRDSHTSKAVVTFEPTPGTTVTSGQKVQIRFDITDGDAQNGVIFSIGNQLVSLEGTPPYTVDYIIPENANGKINIYAQTVNEDLNSETYTVESYVIANNADLGKGFVLSGQTKETSTTAHFSGGVSVESAKLQQESTITLDKEVVVSGGIVPATEHIGQSADIVAAGFYLKEGFLKTDGASAENCDPTLANSVANGGYYMMKQPGDQYCSWVINNGTEADQNWCVSQSEKNTVLRERPKAPSDYFKLWDGNLTNLIAIDKVTLKDFQDVSNLYKGRFDAPGHVCFYFGYRLPDGTLVFNGEQTINVRIKP